MILNTFVFWTFSFLLYLLLRFFLLSTNLVKGFIDRLILNSAIHAVYFYISHFLCSAWLPGAPIEFIFSLMGVIFLVFTGVWRRLL